MTGLVIPSGNIIIPLILWLNKKDKIIGLKDIGANLLNFQIVWTFLAFTALIISGFLKIIHFEIEPGALRFSLYFWVALYIILPILFAAKIKNGKMGNFYPNIIKLIK